MLYDNFQRFFINLTSKGCRQEPGEEESDRPIREVFVLRLQQNRERGVIEKGGGQTSAPRDGQERKREDQSAGRH